MTPEEFRAALRRLGWKQADFCRRAGLAENTVSNWQRREDVPAWAAEYLRALGAIKSLHDAYIAPPKRQQDTPNGASGAGIAARVRELEAFAKSQAAPAGQAEEK